jgi:alanyl-tRNA synthetase
MSFSPEEWPAAKVRQTYLDFFTNKAKHTAVPSSPVVPIDDPTLLFTNAGMNQFKPIFLGNVDPASPLASLTRATDSQKCIRAGGKHNDLDDVGKDTYHHTFFEMLGNWSFGDYFKEEAITWAFQLLTEVFHLPKDRIYASYFGGDEAAGLAADEEAKAIWLRLLPAERVLPFDMKDNFWEMGETGPCGPCSEIHFDRIGGRDAAALVNADDPMVIEIWNLVFIQYNRKDANTLQPLPAKHVDTGMGFERIASILQGVQSNYDTDIFMPLFAAIQRECPSAPAYAGKLGEEDRAAGSQDMAYRVIADHIRTLVFAINDGAEPNNLGRGYVLRRIVRRAVRFGQQCLGAPRGFFSNLVKDVVALMGDAFPELRNDPAHIEMVIAREEALFLRTLDHGTKRLTKELALLEKGQALGGDVMFDLYSTYGFPKDLTVLMAEEQGVACDEAGYDRAAAEFVQVSKDARVAAQAGSGASPGVSAAAAAALGVHAVADLKEMAHVSVTDDSPKYDADRPSASDGLAGTIVALRVYDEATTEWTFVPKVAADSTSRAVGVVLDRTPFYAEAGGQIGDTGEILAEAGEGVVLRLDVSDTQSAGGYVVHGCYFSSTKPGASIAVGDAVTALVDADTRAKTTANHTATHLLNWALRNVVGKHVSQRGSKVEAGVARFDFSNDGPVTPEQLAEVDRKCAAFIAAKETVYWADVALERAREINGLTAVFGEKYPDPVRVVSIGRPVEHLLADPTHDWGTKYAIEFCGGTHMRNTGLAKSFATVSEGALAQGIRRVVCLTGDLARQAFQSADELDGQVRLLAARFGKIPADEWDTQRKEVAAAVDAARIPVYRRIAARKQVADLVAKAMKEAKAAAAGKLAELKTTVAAEVADLADGSNVVRLFTDSSVDIKTLNNLTSLYTDKKIAVMMISVTGKATAAVPKEREAEVHAGNWIKAAVAPGGGKGGGKAGKAAGSFTDVSKVDEVVAAARAFAKLD